MNPPIDRRQTDGDRSILPVWLKGCVSAAIVAYLLGLGSMVLSAPSGPWPVDEGSAWATPPQFAQAIGDWSIPILQVLKLSHNYHFLTNRPNAECQLEAVLRDATGKETGRLWLPTDQGFAVSRHHQRMLARNLNDDQRVEPPAGEFIPAPNQPTRSAAYWEFREGRRAVLTTVAEHLLPRDRPLSAPSAWSMLLARSYARHLLRQTGSDRVEILRHTKDHIPPDVLFADTPPSAGAFDEIVMSFGEFHATPAASN